MFRLRTTVSLSLLALAIGVAGTFWLSTLTGDWKGPAGMVSASRDPVRMVLRRRHARPVEHGAAIDHPASAPMPVPSEERLPALTPVETPSLPARWLQRSVFANGRVMLRLTVDGEGRVAQSTVAESSGNAALDDRALQTVSRWRFAVPSDHPEGLSGVVVMRFDDRPAAPP
ncbi:energy transducer TonB [Dyella sp. C11]|uniref:energy transducer TonB family protein n=1 Tax=Dyella sp. C11 TaxID=2126991 RepID=UPI000D64D0CD|nr:energy transducer TonB [Dyella sp. C11]